MDSDQSEELFSDDDNEETVKDSSVKYPEIDPYHSSFNNSHFFNEYSPCQQKNPNSAEIPTTPFSLIPYISKAQLWTSDLETPSTKRATQVKTPIDVNLIGQENSVSSPRVHKTIKTPMALDSPSSDEIIPGSQESLKRKRRKRPSRRILNNISNSFSDDDLHQDKHSQGCSNDRDSDASNRKLSPIKEYSIDESLEEIERRRSKEHKIFKTITPGERIRQLRELKKSHYKQETFNIIDMPESELVKGFKVLEYNHQFINLSQKKINKNPCDQVGLITFSQIIKHEDEVDNYLNKTIESIADNIIDTQTEELVENEDFRGFSVYSQDHSKLICSEYQNFLCDTVHDWHCPSTKYWKILEGFCLDEIEQSTNIATKYKAFYNNYLTDNFPISKRKVLELIFSQKKSATNVLPPIKMSLTSWWTTASGKELFVDVNTVHQSESWLLEDDFSKHSIDILLPMQTQDNFCNKSNDFVQDHQKQLAEKLNNIQDFSQQNLEYENIKIENLINSEIQEIMNFNNDINSRRDIDDHASFQQSISTVILETRAKDFNIKDESQCSQLTQLNPDINNKNILNNFSKPETVQVKAIIHAENDAKTKNYEFIQPVPKKQMTYISKLNSMNMTHVTGINIIGKNLIKIENVHKDKKNESLESISMNTTMIGFQTDHRKQIRVPEYVLLKAKNIIADKDDDLIWNTELKTNDLELEVPKPSKQVPNCSKTMVNLNKVHDQNRNNSKKSMLIAKKMFEIEEDKSLDIPMNPMLMGFQTGRGKSIKLSKDILSIGQNTFAGENLNFDELLINPVATNDYLIPGKEVLLKAKNTIADEDDDVIWNTELKTNDLELEVPKPSKQVPNCSKTMVNLNKVHDQNRNNSKKSMLIAKKMFEIEEDKSLDIPMNPMFMGFQTGRGKSIKLSKDILSKGQNIFAGEDLNFDELPINPVATNGYSVPGEVSNIPPMIGFHTGSGKNVKVPDNALSKAIVEYFKDADENVSLEKLKILNRIKNNPQVSTEQSSSSNIVDSEKKRKHLNDDETPAGRKKARMGLDLQKRKLFEGIEEEDEALMQADLMEVNECNIDSDRKFSNINLRAAKITCDTETTCLNSSGVITDEILGSVAAFENDDIDFSEIGDKWIDNEDNCSSRKFPRSRTSVGSCPYPTEQHDKINECKPAKRPRSYPGSSEPINITVSDFKSPKHDSIPDELYFDTQFPQEVISSHSIEQLQEQRAVAVLEQEKAILYKKRSKVKPIIGSLLNNKQTNVQISLKKIYNPSPSLLTSDQDLGRAIDNSMMSVNSSTAGKYQFNLNEFFGQTFLMNNGCRVPVGDGAILIPNQSYLAGPQEFKQSFLASPGVDPSLLPNGWVENHYKWIVWKLASMERFKISKKLSGRFLTPDRVMKQLKYRYDREIDRSQRPALRRVLEKDDAPLRRMVLCVSRVPEDNLGQEIKSRTIELTDGWYSVPAIIDYAMVPYINSGKIKEGTKLMIFGAELSNHEEGRFPLDISSDVRLKIHTNSTRRARWDAKLGYQRQCGPMKTTLKAIKSNGGFVGKFTVVVARIYPLVFREKTANGESIIRNARCEEKAEIAYEKECQSRIESIYFKAQQSEESTSTFELEDRVRNCLPTKRDVTPILKIKISDNDCFATLSVWSCGEDTQSSFKENTCITIYNASVSGKRLNELQITAGRSTIFEHTSLDCGIIRHPRIFSPLEDATLPGFNPEYGEFDTIGIIVSIGPAPHGMRNFETVNIAFKNHDNEDSPSFYLSILFWKGVSSYGFAEIATVGSFIACINLECRKSTYKSIPTAFCTERTLLTRNPRQHHLCHEFDAFRARIRDTSAYIESSAAIIQAEIDKKSYKTTPGSRSSINANSDRRRSSNNWTPENRDHSLVNPDSISRSEARKVAITNRLEKLRHYGDAPDLSPVHLAQTPRVSLDFQLPVAQLPKSSNT